MTRLSAIVLAAIVLNASAASAQPPLESAESFAVLAGTAVSCTDSTVTGDVGVWPGTEFNPINCIVEGTVHAGDSVAEQAFLDFVSAYNNLRDNPPDCDDTLTGTLAGEVLEPGVYCVDEVAKTGTLTLDGDANDVWIFLVKDSAGAGTGALTGTNFNVVMAPGSGGQPCNVYWWVEVAATMTTSNFLGTILASAAITVTGGTFDGHALAKKAVTLTTGATVSACSSSGVPPDEDECKDHHGKCKCKCKCHDGDHDGDDDEDTDKGKGKGKGHKDNDRKDTDRKDNDRKDNDRESKNKKRG